MAEELRFQMLTIKPNRTQTVLILSLKTERKEPLQAEFQGERLKPLFHWKLMRE